MSEEKKDLKTNSPSPDKAEKSDKTEESNKAKAKEKENNASSQQADKKDQVKKSAEAEQVSAEKKEDTTEKESSPQKDDSSKTDDSPKTEDKPKQEANSKKEDTAENKKTSKEPVKLNALFAFKMSMTRFYNEKGESLPVTALKYEPSFVSQIKTEEKDSYQAIQVAFKAQKNKRCSKSVIQHLKSAGFKEGAQFIKEIKQTVPENIQVGDELSIHSLEKGDLVKISAVSKGKGFAGVMKRWNFSGGRASHGSKAHRRTGSIGQHTKPGRVFPGRKMPGRQGFQQVSRLKVPVVEVLPEERIIFVKGPVPGARNTLVSLQKI